VRPAKPLENLGIHPRTWSLALVALVAIPFTACGAASENGRPPGQHNGPPQFLPITAQWCLSGGIQPPRCIQLEVPQGDRQFALGLQKRPPLPPLRGMWFSFSPPAPARFWMHHTPAPLDMLFVQEGRVIHIETEVPPCPSLPCTTYGTGTAVDGVVELAAGQAAALGITVGTPVRILPLQTSVPAAPARD
jgi:uncharacterized protein